MKLTFKGVDISTEEKFVSYINSLNTAIMKQNAMNEIKQDFVAEPPLVYDAMEKSR